jgi:aminopeptidase N
MIDGWRPLHYEVSLTFNRELSELLSARTELTVRILKDNVTTVDLDFGDLLIDSVTIEGKQEKYSRSRDKVLITLPRMSHSGDQLSIAVSYHGRPKDGLILTNDKDGKASVTGDNWPDRVHNWIPSLDHPSAKATVRFTVTAPARDMVVANGVLEGTRSNSNNTRTWIWDERVPISPYCIIIAVGDFARVEPAQQGVPQLTYYVPQSDSSVASKGFSTSSSSLKFFSETVGPFPYEKLALIVGATRYGGMENSTAIVFSSNLFDNFTKKQPRSHLYDIPTSVRDVVSHEIAHQWFGDSVTEATWADLWLSEGFATYFAALSIERYEGKGEFRAYMKAAAEKYFAYEKEHKTPIHDKDTEDLYALLNPNNYEKGAWVLHMLRGLTGDKSFFEGLRNYYSTHRNATATTEDLRESLEMASGLNLKDFFRQWVYESGHPKYEVAWRWEPNGNSKQTGNVDLVVRQVQDGSAFLIPLTVEILSANGTQRVTITPTAKETAARIPVPRQPTSITLDPDQIVLKEIAVVRRD